MEKQLTKKDLQEVLKELRFNLEHLLTIEFYSMGAFHVRSGPIGQRYEIWECFEKLTDARNKYKKIKI